MLRSRARLCCSVCRCGEIGSRRLLVHRRDARLGFLTMAGVPTFMIPVLLVHLVIYSLIKVPAARAMDSFIRQLRTVGLA